MATDPRSDRNFDLVSASRTTQQRFNYFLLGGSAAAIAYALTQSKDQPLSWSGLPLAFALAAWGASFIYGCNVARTLDAILGGEVERHRLRTGLAPLAQSNPQQASKRLQKISETMDEKAATYKQSNDRQYWLLLSGAAFYICWRVVLMWELTSTAAH